jgi:hypothetical protein
MQPTLIAVERFVRAADLVPAEPVRSEPSAGFQRHLAKTACAAADDTF